MIDISVQIGSHKYLADINNQQSIAITLTPDGDQPNHFGAPGCTSQTLQGGDFVGDTNQGGSCNVNQLTIIPHCNGTHTESIAHIVNQSVAPYQAVEKSIFTAILISITPVKAVQTSEQYLPQLDHDNQVITRKQLEMTLKNYTDEQMIGLIIRSLPNSNNKKQMTYDSEHYPVYLTNDAMNYIVERKIQHLLVDFPSVDKMYDDGRLTNHRIFWNVAEGDKNLSTTSFINKTITEMIFVNQQVSDGFYLCQLQLPQIETDAVPSRPVLIPLKQQN